MRRSFDFFDTLGVRRVLRPEDIFNLLEIRLVAVHGKKFVGFAGLRRAAELAAKERQRDRDGGWEVTLNEIYNVLRQRTPTFDWDNVRDLELEIELQHILPITANLDKLKAEESAIILSDTSHSSDALERLLTQSLGGCVINRRIYTSSDLRENKHSGKLFHMAAEREKINVRSLSHLGDNKYSDVEMAVRQGVSAEHFAASQPTRYEENLGQKQLAYDVRASLSAGAARAARLAKPSDVVGDQSTIWDTGCGVIGPALLDFVLWILKSVSASGVGRIYFLSRDGQILHRLAEQVVAALNLRIECRYIYVSRQALHLPSIIGTIQEMDWEWLFERTTFLSLRTIFGRAGIEPSEVFPLLPAGLVTSANLDQNLAEHLRAAIEAVFREDKRIHLLILQAAERKRNVALEYFRASGLLDQGKRFAVVDIGWNGRLQRSLSKILATATSTRYDGIDGYYFGLIRRASPNSNDSLFAYAFAPEVSVDQPLSKYRYLIEIFTAADHGSCVGYKYDELLGTVVPHLEASIPESGPAWGVPVQQQAVLKFSEYFLQGCLVENVSPDGMEKAVVLLNIWLFCSSPSRPEADGYGKFFFFEDHNHSVGHELAPIQSPLALLKIAIGFAPRPHGNFWGEGAIARQGGLAAKILKLSYKIYKNARVGERTFNRSRAGANSAARIRS